MNEIDVPGGASYGPSFLVALGWYATVIAALVTGVLSLPDVPAAECLVPTVCDDATVVVLVIVLTGPGALVVPATALTTALTCRWVSSPFLAGSLAVAGTVLLAVPVTAFWLGR